jgi:hypothetical protein
MNDNACRLFNKEVKVYNNASYQETPRKVPFYDGSVFLFGCLIVLSALSLLVTSDLLLFGPKNAAVYASSSESQQDDDGQEEEENNTNNLESLSEAGVSSGTGDGGGGGGLLQYNNSEYGIRINYPTDWSYQELETPTNVAVVPIVNIFPPISDDPNAVSFLQIGIEDLASPFSVDEYSRSIINGYRESRSDFDLISSNTDGTISGLPAYEVIFTDSANGTDRKIMEVGALDSDNNRVYYLLFNTEESRYDTFVPTLESIISSFQLGSVSEEGNLIDSNINGDGLMLPDNTTQSVTDVPPSDTEFSELSSSESVPQNDTNLSSSLSSAAIEGNDILLYENSSYGISLFYPAGWNQFHPVSDPEGRTTFIAQFEPADVDGIALFAVARDTFSSNETLDTYLAETVQSYRGNTLNFTLISTGISPDVATPPLLAGNPAYSLLYTHTNPESGAMLLTQEVGTIIPETNMVYYVYYTADIANYNQFIDDVLAMADSLELHLTDLNIAESEELDILDILESLQSGEI